MTGLAWGERRTELSNMDRTCPRQQAEHLPVLTLKVVTESPHSVEGRIRQEHAWCQAHKKRS